MKSKFITSLLAAGVMLVGTSAYALTDAQKASVNASINSATAANLSSVAASLLTSNCPDGDDECLQFIITAAKNKLGAGASISSVRNLVNALVQAAPNKAASIVTKAGSAFPGMKANIAAAAQSGLATAQSQGKITAAQAGQLSGAVNAAGGITGSTTGGSRGGSLFMANQVAANAAARTEFQRSNQNNYSAP